MTPRLTYRGDRFATARGWVSDNEVLVLSRTGQHSSMKTWAFAAPLSGPARRLDYGQAGDVAVRDGAVLVGSAMDFEPAEPAQWKRYRGGAGGKIWYSPDGSHYTRIFADVGDNLVNPMFVGSRVVFLSDHEGTGALYSALPDGTDLRRHTDLGQYYARHATTDGQRVVYQRAGEFWLLESLDAEPVRLNTRVYIWQRAAHARQARKTEETRYLQDGQLSRDLPDRNDQAPPGSHQECPQCLDDGVANSPCRLGVSAATSSLRSGARRMAGSAASWTPGALPR